MSDWFVVSNLLRIMVWSMVIIMGLNAKKFETINPTWVEKQQNCHFPKYQHRSIGLISLGNGLTHQPSPLS